MENLVGQRVAANLFRGAEAVGGHIRFTPDSMIFESHAFNVQTGTLQIFYKQIHNICPRATLGIVPNGISSVLLSSAGL